MSLASLHPSPSFVEDVDWENDFPTHRCVPGTPAYRVMRLLTQCTDDAIIHTRLGEAHSTLTYRTPAGHGTKELGETTTGLWASLLATPPVELTSLDEQVLYALGDHFDVPAAEIEVLTDDGTQIVWRVTHRRGRLAFMRMVCSWCGEEAHSEHAESI